MKKAIFCMSLVGLMSLYKIDSSAQTLASNFTAQSAKNLQPVAAKKLAAIVIQSPDNKFSLGLHVESYLEGKLSIKLKSARTVLHKEVVDSKTYARKYDMYNLPVGDYQIEVENKQEVYTKKMSIQIQNGVRVLSLL